MTRLAEFDSATSVEATGDGRFAGAVDPRWDSPIGPNGGFLAAVAVRALEAGLDPGGGFRPRSLTLHFLRRPVHGPIEFEVESVRSGRRLHFGRLTGRQDGREVLTGLAALAVPGLAEVAAWSPAMPDAGPAPDGDDGWPSREEPMPPLMQRVRIAPRFGAPPFSGHVIEPGEIPTTGGWIELAEPRGIDAAFVALCTDVWWPPALEPLTEPAAAPTIDLTIHFRADLPPGGLADQPVLGQFTSSASLGGLVEEDGVVFAADGTLLAQSRQLALFTPLG